MRMIFSLVDGDFGTIRNSKSFKKKVGLLRLQ